MKYFKIQKGFGADDYLSIDETELEMAIRAQITGKVAIFKSGTISGNIIQAITPDYNRDMGWKRDYKLNGEDYAFIGKEKTNEYRLLVQNTNNEVLGQLGMKTQIKLPQETSNEVKTLANKMSV